MAATSDERVGGLDPGAELRKYWDVDAATYDRAPEHDPTSASVRAAWRAAVARLLPPAPSTVLDVGAGTGFLSLLAAELGHRVTALDLSTEMLARLRDKADSRGLEIETVEESAEAPSGGDFDAVIERHLVWTLPDPAAALAAWRAAAPDKLTATAPSHHADYSPELMAALPYGHNLTLEQLVELVESTGWGAARLERLRDVEWTMAQAQVGVQRLLGVSPRYAVTAG
jgi:ubiquinone/menaquinone biosynthesis C-methylase UbiE